MAKALPEFPYKRWKYKSNYSRITNEIADESKEVPTLRAPLYDNIELLCKKAISFRSLKAPTGGLSKNFFKKSHFSLDNSYSCVIVLVA